MRLVVHAGAFHRVLDTMDEAGIARGRLLVVSGRGPTFHYARELLTAAGTGAVAFTCDEGTVAHSAQLASVAIAEGATAIVAIGGGTVLDVAKFAAARTGVAFVSVPTSLANDGISSPVVSLWDKTGARVSLGARMPAAVIVDTELVLTAPPHLLAAGVGDLASNLVAIADWRLAAASGEDSYDEFSALIGEAAAQMIWELPDLDSPSRAARLARGLLLSGVAMATAGTTRPCSGSEHLVSHALDAILGSRALPHGIQVGLATLMLAGLHGLDVGRLRGVFRSCGMPLSLSDAGLDLETVVKAVQLAPSMRADRFTILNVLAADGTSVRELVHALLLDD